MRNELPTGTVTFLFTDVEGSTRLLQEHGAEYARLLSEHRRALRAAFVEHGGVEVDTQGDAFFVAFARASDALAAAAAGRAALEGGPIRVRMGLHTGEPVVTEEGYVGMDVHRAARIAAVGHGGQVLVSQATRDLAAADALRDLGEHRLKDLSAPERLFQLGGGSFPPLRTLYQTNLPIPATPFVGREHEVEEVARRLESEDVHLLTLTGPGGCGKTRLALQAAAHVAERYPDGVRWLPLAPVREAGLVADAIADAVAADGAPAAAIGDRRLLLLLDNFEHVVDAAPVVAELLAECPRLDVLVTSRERLAIGGEQEYETPALARADAVELFTHRARALRPGFVADDDVADVCSRLDDLPLAVELAAARVKVFTPRQLLDRLGRRLDLLKGGRGADPRQATLRATIEWSHELLSPEEQQAFARLGVFVGAWTLELAENICGADPDVVETLVDKSLVRAREARSGIRFWMLETIREFAVERLTASGEEPELRRRHAETYARRLTDADTMPYGPDRTRVFDELADELPNLRAALAWARSAGDGATVLRMAFAGRNLLSRRNPGELRAVVEDGLASAPNDPALRSAGLGVAAFAAFREGDFGPAHRMAEEAIELARGAGEARLVGFSLNARAAVDVAVGDTEAARRAYEECARTFEALDDTRALAVVEHNLADLELQAGAYDVAAAHADNALASMTALGDRDGMNTSFVNAALARLLLGEHAAAEALAREGLELSAKLESPYEIACGLIILAVVAARSGRMRLAGTLCGAADAMLETVDVALEPVESSIRERVRAIARDSTEFTAGEARGRSSTAEALALALAGDDA